MSAATQHLLRNLIAISLAAIVSLGQGSGLWHTARADTLPPQTVKGGTVTPTTTPPVAPPVASTPIPIPGISQTGVPTATSTVVTATQGGIQTPIPVVLPPSALVTPTPSPSATTTASPTPGQFAQPTPAPTAASANTSSNSLLKPGDLDKTFGNDGIVTTRIAGQLTQLALYGRSHFFAFATSRTCINLLEPCIDTLVIARFKDSGRLDERFGEGGSVTLSGPFLGFTNVLVLPEGKFVIGVGALPQTRKPGLLRLDVDGRIDRSFGADGQAVTEGMHKGTRRALQPAHLALQADGKIVVIGSERIGDWLNGTQQFILSRYTRTGQLDTTFARSGIIRHSDLTTLDADTFGTQVFVQPNGNIVAVGRASNADGIASFIYQFNAAGRQIFPSATARNTLYGLSPECQTTWLNLRMHVDGKFSVYRKPATNACKAIYYRVNPDLSLDTSVDILTTTVPSIHAVQVDGKLLSAGQGSPTKDKDASGTEGLFAVFRYLESGQADLSFGDDGMALGATTTTWPGQANFLTIQLDGAILAGGNYSTKIDGENNSFVILARFINKPGGSTKHERFIPIIMNR